MKQLRLLFLFLFFSTPLHAVKDYWNTTYGNQQITTETILKLAPEMPSTLHQDLQKWLAIKENVQLIKTLLANHPAQECKKAHFLNKKLLIEHGITNLGKGSYVFFLPTNPNYVVKISGPHLRFNNLLAAAEKYHYSYLPPETGKDEERLGELNDIYEKQKNTKTFQHVSRLATWLVLKYVLASKNITSITIVDEMYLAAVPDRPSTVEDSNYFIIEKTFKNPKELVALENNVTALNELSPSVIEDFFEATVGVGLWDLHSNTKVYSSEKPPRIILPDLEQPDNTDNKNGAVFFQKEKKKYENNTKCGLGEMNVLFRNNPNLRGALRAKVESDPRLQASGWWSELKKIFDVDTQEKNSKEEE